MTNSEWEEFKRWMQTHTALSRVNLAELQTAFERAAAAGYVVIKQEPAETAAA